MIKPREWSSVHLEVIPATFEQQPVLANLLELYAHDFSEFHDVALREDGHFGYADLPRYWSDPGRYPFLVRMDGHIAGFVLVKKGSELTCSDTVWDMAEFFVVRGYRRRGAGTEIAHQVWTRFPGQWEVRVMESNQAAHQFWERAIAEFAGKATPSHRVEKDGRDWLLFSFESNPQL
jgi:predicted acetyltransferase